MRLQDRALQLLPHARAAERAAVFDALQLGSACNRTAHAAAVGRRIAGSDFALAGGAGKLGGAMLYVALWGKDEGARAVGSRAQPFATLQRAQMAARAVQRPAAGAEGRVAVLLRCRAEDKPPCVYQLTAPLVLTAADSGTFWGAEPGAAEVVLSGGVPLDGLEWGPAAAGTRVQRAQLPAGLPAAFSSLFVGGERAVLARTPNGNMERALCLNPQFMSSGRVGPQYCPSHFPAPPLTGLSPDRPGWVFEPDMYREGCKGMAVGADAKDYPECFGTVIEVATPYRNGTSWQVPQPMDPTPHQLFCHNVGSLSAVGLQLLRSAYSCFAGHQGGMNPRYTKFIGGVTKRWDPPEAVASVRSLYGGCMSGGKVPPMMCIVSDVNTAYPSLSSNRTDLCPCTVPGGVSVRTQPLADLHSSLPSCSARSAAACFSTAWTGGAFTGRPARRCLRMRRLTRPGQPRAVGSCTASTAASGATTCSRSRVVQTPVGCRS